MDELMVQYVMAISVLKITQDYLGENSKYGKEFVVGMISEVINDFEALTQKQGDLEFLTNLSVLQK